MLVNQRYQQLEPSSVSPHGTGLWVGPFHGVRRGQGTDFDDLRKYSAGDEVRHIDWKVSARRGSLHTRLYREEKERVITFVADFRRTMFNGSNELLSVTTGRMIAALLWHAIDEGSRVSIKIICDDAIHSTQPASGHKSAIAACGLLASTFESARANSSTNQTDSTIKSVSSSVRPSTGPSLTQALDELLSAGRRVGTIVLASNFVEAVGATTSGESFSSRNSLGMSLLNLSLARPVVAIYLEDPLCFEGLPSGRYRYLTHSGGQPAPRITQLRSRDKQRLKKQLAKQHSLLCDLFESAKVSLIDGRIGYTNIKTELIRQGFLA